MDSINKEMISFIVVFDQTRRLLSSFLLCIFEYHGHSEGVRPISTTQWKLIIQRPLIDENF